MTTTAKFYGTPEHDEFCRRAIRELLGCVRYWRGIGCPASAKEVLWSVRSFRVGLLRAHCSPKVRRQS